MFKFYDQSFSEKHQKSHLRNQARNFPSKVFEVIKGKSMRTSGL